MQFSSTSCYFSPLRPKNLPQHPIALLQFWASLRVNAFAWVLSCNYTVRLSQLLCTCMGGSLPSYLHTPRIVTKMPKNHDNKVATATRTTTFSMKLQRQHFPALHSR
jgi:hypothetical protein